MKVHFGNLQAIDTVTQAVPLYGNRQFESPTRSTVPLLSLLHHAPTKFKEIVDRLGFPSGYDLFLEYTVSPPVGRGKASHTDVMLRVGEDALAIEAKWTEPVGTTIGKWLKDGKMQANREAVLKGWRSLLKKHVQTSFDVAKFNDVVYQMLHRAASATATGSKPRLAYFLFTPSPNRRTAKPKQIRNQLALLWECLGKPKDFPFCMVEITICPLEAYKHLKNLPKANGTSESVRAALLASEPLFQFSEYKVERIGEEETRT